MELAVLKETKEWASIENFVDFYYSLRLQLLESDLLNQGLSPKQIIEAVLMAVNVGKSSGINVREHFKPVFSGIDKKLSVIANAPDWDTG